MTPSVEEYVVVDVAGAAAVIEFRCLGVAGTEAADSEGGKTGDGDAGRTGRDEIPGICDWRWERRLES